MQDHRRERGSTPCVFEVHSQKCIIYFRSSGKIPLSHLEKGRRAHKSSTWFNDESRCDSKRFGKVAKVRFSLLLFFSFHFCFFVQVFCAPWYNYRGAVTRPLEWDHFSRRRRRPRLINLPHIVLDCGGAAITPSHFAAIMMNPSSSGRNTEVLRHEVSYKFSWLFLFFVFFLIDWSAETRPNRFSPQEYWAGYKFSLISASNALEGGGGDVFCFSIKVSFSPSSLWWCEWVKWGWCWSAASISDFSLLHTENSRPYFMEITFPPNQNVPPRTKKICIHSVESDPVTLKKSWLGSEAPEEALIYSSAPHTLAMDLH